jgi:O-antigen/teichoic acid export membrane protein
VVVLLAGGNMKTLALWQLMPWLVVTGWVLLDLSRRAPHLLPGLSHASLAVTREIIKPSMVFAVIVVAMSMTQQGSIQVISITLGSVAVAVFTTARTLTNIAMQSVNIIKSTAWPDLTILFANQEWARLRKLLRLLITVSLTVCIAIATTLFFEGLEVLRAWTHKPLPVDRLFLGLFLLYVVLQSPWMICSGLLIAVNRHHRLAVSYVASSVIGIVLAALLTPRLGLAAVPLGLMLGEVLACYHFVVKDACELVGEPYRRFAGRLWLGMALVLVPTVAAGWLAHQAAWGPNVLRWLEVGAATTVEAGLMAWWAILDVEDRIILLKRMGVLFRRKSTERLFESAQRPTLVAAAREDDKGAREGANLVGR